MVERLKNSLVKSFVGAIVVGWLFAEGLLHMVGIVTGPLMAWEARSAFTTFKLPIQPYPWGTALPEAISAGLLLLTAYGLLRWLYYEPMTEDSGASDGEGAGGQG
jgi:hypothetical protein